ncbi:LuxR family transcriptional regulator [Kitasatospora nipponensis]|uniref:LuxR family transcriptional regulator n=1 Tax=Kitasatospora nipponensis TaxID=258049 RepID=A0ABN1WF92_9ACTN
MQPTEPSARPPARQCALTALAEALAEPPVLLLVGGERGIGKTHLVRHLLAHPALAGRTALTGRCLDLYDRPPLLPVLDALAAWSPPARGALPPLTGALRPLLPELAGHLPPEPGTPPGDPLHPSPGPHPSADPHPNPNRALCALLAAAGPAVLVLEDLQWADHATQDLLRHLLARPPRDLAVVLTHRDDPASTRDLLTLLATRPGDGMRRIEHRVEPLDSTELAEFAARRLGSRRPSQDFVQALHRRTAAIPEVVAEVLDQLATAGDQFCRDPAPGDASRGDPPPDAAALAALGVPGRLRDQVLAAFHTLGTEARLVLAGEAVAEAVATVRHLADVAALPGPLAARGVEEALDHALLHPDAGGAYRLRHPLARQALYEAQPPHRRQELHLRAARALLAEHPRPLPLDRIAHHYRLAGRTSHWLRYAEAAADQAAARAEHDAAADLLLAALPCAAASRLRVRLALKLGRAALHARTGHHAIDALRRVLDQEQPAAATRGEIRLSRGILMRNQGYGTVGLDEIARAVPDLETRPDLAARAMAAIALPSTTGLPLVEHGAWMARARRMSLRVQDPVLRLAIAVNHAAALMFTADPRARQAADALPESADTAAQRTEIARGNASLAYAATVIGHPQRARTHLDRAQAAMDETRTYLSGHLATARLLLDWTTGHWEDLPARAATVATDYADIPDLVAECLLLQGLHTLAVRGNLTRTRELLELAADTTRYDTGIVLPSSAAALARIETAAGNWDRAVDLTSPVLAHIRRTGAWMWATDPAPPAVEAFLRGGRRREAECLVREFTTGLQGRDTPAARAALATCRALLAEATGHPREAATGYERAVRAWRAARRPYEAARATEAEGRCLLDLAAVEAQPTYARALLADAQLGAAWDAAHARHTLREHGIVLTHRRGPRGYGNTLSPREAEVAQLAGAGRSNQQIAEALFLSPRTVEQHVAKALRKLGLHTRADLAPRRAATPTTPAGPAGP